MRSYSRKFYDLGASVKEKFRKRWKQQLGTDYRDGFNLINLFHLKKCLIGCAIDQDNDNTTLNVQ